MLLPRMLHEVIAYNFHRNKLFMNNYIRLRPLKVVFLAFSEFHNRFYSMKIGIAMVYQSYHPCCSV